MTITDSWFDALGTEKRELERLISERAALEVGLRKVAQEVGLIISAREGMITELVHPRHLSIED